LEGEDEIGKEGLVVQVGKGEGAGRPEGAAGRGRDGMVEGEREVVKKMGGSVDNWKGRVQPKQ
jgi:hypothetical protein